MSAVGGTGFGDRVAKGTEHTLLRPTLGSDCCISQNGVGHAVNVLMPLILNHKLQVINFECLRLAEFAFRTFLISLWHQKNLIL